MFSRTWPVVRKTFVVFVQLVVAVVAPKQQMVSFSKQHSMVFSPQETTENENTHQCVFVCMYVISHSLSNNIHPSVIGVF